MFNILLAYANYDNEVGYVQGMNYIVALLLFYLPDSEEDVFWGLHQLMQRKSWRMVYTHNFPKLKSITKLLESRIHQEFPRVLKHMKQNFMEVEGTFSPHFMTLYVYLTPIEIATRLFEIFLLDGENALIRMLLKMIALKQKAILSKDDMDLQRYLLSDMVIECVNQYSLTYLLDF